MEMLFLYFKLSLSRSLLKQHGCRLVYGVNKAFQPYLKGLIYAEDIRDMIADLRAQLTLRFVKILS